MPASRRGGARIRLHRSRSLDARDRTTHEGIPITTVARTLLDLAAIVEAGRLERALAQAEHLQLYDHVALLDVLERGNGHQGTAILAAATRRDPKWTRSEFEAEFLQLLRAAGLPEPLVNHTLDAPDHPGLEVDFLWPAAGLIVETDGWETHRSRAAFEADRRKDAALTAGGYRVVRFTRREVSEHSRRVVARLRSLLPYSFASASRNASSSGSSIE